MSVTKKLPVKRRSRNSLSPAEILEAALIVLKSEGIENLSMRRIASQLNCSVASPYAHFKNQQEIIQQLISIGERKLTEDLRSAKSRHTDVFNQLSAIAHTYWDFATANRELHKLMFNQLKNKNSKLFTYTPASYRVFLDTLRRGFKSGQIPFSKRKYHAIARTMWAWIYGLIVLDLTDAFSFHDIDSDPVEDGIIFFQEFLKKGDESE